MSENFLNPKLAAFSNFVATLARQRLRTLSNAQICKLAEMIAIAMACS